MTTAKATANTTAKKTASKKASQELPDTFHRITALLHTMRCIVQHEDRLCLLRNEIKRTQAVGPRLLKDLNALLEELPAEEYTSDLHAVEAALSSIPPPAKKAGSPATKASNPPVTSKPKAKHARKPAPAAG